jgi:hypothetical protein
MDVDGNADEQESYELETATNVGNDPPRGPDDQEKGLGWSEVPFDCRVAGSNAGCRTVASCPTGTAIVDLKAACNLELGAVTDAELDGTFWNSLKIVKQSDIPGDGKCTLNDYGFIYTSTARTGATKVVSYRGLQSIVAECDEHDRNGGDCHIRGKLICE